MIELKDRLLTARRAADKTQAEVADAVGMAQPSYSDLEAGKAQGSKFLVQIADYLGVSAVWLASGRGAMLADGSAIAQPVPLNPERAAAFLGNITKAQAHLGAATAALSSSKDGEGAALFARLCEVRESLDALVGELQPAIFFQDDTPVHGA
ncbi:helix-turn-helix transcriptional regulator [Microbulbifer sp. SAOS-129_SWC]|uniref:helix-turn-helix domain-containing protein n=1 Tax=Microbulbifer sp. SAOS-129_SWC TaxID=3145235 RepID=UPI003217E740